MKKKLEYFLFSIIIAEINLTNLCFAQSADFNVDEINQRINLLEQHLQKQEIARDYFQSTLLIQTGIFSAIIILTLAVIAIINWKTRKSEIEEAVRKMEDQIRTEFVEKNKKSLKLIEEKEKSLLALIKVQGDNIKLRFNTLEGDIYRGFAYIHKWPSTSFLWWLRAAGAYKKVGEDELINIALKNAKLKVKDIERPLEPKELSEIERIFSLLESDYKLQIDIIRKIFQKKISSSD